MDSFAESKSQSLIALYREESFSSYDELLTELRSQSDFSVLEIKSLDALEKTALDASIHILLLIVSREPSSLLVEAVSKHRNMTQLRNTRIVALHRFPSHHGFQKSLMLGAKIIFLEPIRREKVVREIRSALNLSPTSIPIQPIYYPVFSECRAEVFGRIGKIMLDELGDLTVETDIKFPEGHSIDVYSRMAQDFRCQTLSYRVSGQTSDDTYYQYRYSYHFSWQADLELKRQFESWLKKRKDLFSVPKTKVLWITEKPISELEPILDKKIFSVYVQKSGRLTRSYLQKLNPRILISGLLPEVGLNSIQSWIEEKTEERLLVCTDSLRLNGWSSLPFGYGKEFRAAFIELAKPFLMERVKKALKSFRYISRSSPYSRIAFSVNLQMVSVSKTHLQFLSSILVEKDTILLAHCPLLEEKKSSGLYLKVLSAEPIESRFRLTCELVPISDETPSGILSWIYSQEESRHMDEKSVLTRSWGHRPSPLKTPELFFLRKHQFLIDLGKVLIGVSLFLILAAILTYTLPRSEIHSNEPSGMDEAFRAIRKAFR